MSSDSDDGGGAAAVGVVDQRYSFSSSAKSHEDEEEELMKMSYFDAASAAVKGAPSSSSRGSGTGTGTGSSSAASSSDGSGRPTSAAEATKLDLLDVPVDGTRVIAKFNDGPSPSDQRFEEDTNGPDRHSPTRHHKANQQYYDVLEMATNRLQQDGSGRSGGSGSGRSGPDENDLSSGDEAVRKKKKKKKSKSKKEKRRSHRAKGEGADGDVDVEGGRRSAVFQSLFPPSMMVSHKGINKKPFETSISRDDLAKIGYKDDEEPSLIGYSHSDEKVEGGNDIDPNDDLPPSGASRWNPAALVTAAQSKLSHGKIDQQGFYTNVKGRAGSAKERVQSLVRKGQDKMPNDFNLQSIGKSRKKKKKKYASLNRCDSIDWGDEGSALSQYVSDDGVQASKENGGIEMHNYSYEVNEANQNYIMSEGRVRRLMWQRDKRRIGILLIAAVLFFSVCLGLYLSGGKSKSSSPSPSTLPNAGIGRNDPPPRPVTQPPVHPIDGFDESSLHAITVTDVEYIVNQITPDSSAFGNPHSPQAKALEWCKNDMEIYRVEVASRVAQRYILATLYYSTNGTGWLTNRNWGNGHECEWYGVGCEAGENNVVSVTYLDLNSNHLDGSIPPEVGYISTLEQIHLWGNKLVGSIPNTFSQLAKLHTLYLDDNRLDGEMDDTFNTMKSLKHLDLSENRIRGHVPHGLGGLTNLRDLRLSDNLLTGTFPISLISLSNLQTLLLNSNAISGTLPSLVGEMRSLVTIRIHDNDLKGKLPSFSDAKVLEEAHFDGNYFSGPIPNFVSTRLREVYLGQNALTGSIPDIFGDELEIFSAGNNMLDSTIPSFIANAIQLNILDLSNNKLSGPFPGWLGSLKRLDVLHLNDNLLEGKLILPLDMGDLDDLTEFSIHHNQLTGAIDEFMCDLLLDVLTADCDGSPPPVDCTCCTDCM